MSKVKEAGQTLLKFGAGASGLTVGSIGMKKLNEVLPASMPDIAKKIGPGLAAMLLAFLASAKISNDKAKALFFGLGLAGFADLALKLLGDKVSLIGNNVPSLSGLGDTPRTKAVNTGGIGWDYYRDNSLQGLGADPYALNGDSVSMQGTSMQGNPYALNGAPGGALSAMAPYALN